MHCLTCIKMSDILIQRPTPVQNTQSIMNVKSVLEKPTPKLAGFGPMKHLCLFKITQ